MGEYGYFVVLELELDGLLFVVSWLFVASWLEVAPDDELSLGAVELDDEDDGELLDGVLVEPEPAEPPMVELEDELPGVADVAPFDLLMSTDVDDELEPEGAVLGAGVVPPADDEDDEPEGRAVEPEGAVVELELAPSLARSQAAINEAPSARETATAIEESLMRPPKGWGLPRTREQVTGRDHFFAVGSASRLRGPLPSSLLWKSRCCTGCLGSTCPCCGFEPSLFSALLGAPLADEVVPELVVEPLAEVEADGVSVLDDGGAAVR